MRGIVNLNDNNEESTGTFNISLAQDPAGNVMTTDSSETVSVDTPDDLARAVAFMHDDPITARYLKG